jgi:hypothetical protein
MESFKNNSNEMENYLDSNIVRTFNFLLRTTKFNLGQMELVNGPAKAAENPGREAEPFLSNPILIKIYL